MHDCREELRAASLKITSTRLQILHLLENAALPLDVAQIRRRVHADRVTVFRILNTLSDKGLVHAIQLHEDKFRYEYAGKPEHHHFVCDRCGAVEDIRGCSVKIPKKKGMLITRHSLEFFGLCADCR